MERLIETFCKAFEAWSGEGQGFFFVLMVLLLVVFIVTSYVLIYESLTVILDFVYDMKYPDVTDDTNNNKPNE